MIFHEYSTGSIKPVFLLSFLRWTRREQADFYRTVSSFGVVYDTDMKAFDWSQFRVLARLERKTDESLERYFNSFVNMCRTACKLPPRKDEGTLYCHGGETWQQSEQGPQPPRGSQASPVTLLGAIKWYLIGEASAKHKHKRILN